MVRTGLTSGYGGSGGLSNSGGSSPDDDEEEQNSGGDPQGANDVDNDSGGSSSSSSSSPSRSTNSQRPDQRDSDGSNNTGNTIGLDDIGSALADAGSDPYMGPYRNDPSGANDTEGGDQSGSNQTDDDADSDTRGEGNDGSTSSIAGATTPGFIRTNTDGDPSGANDVDGNDTNSSDSPPDDGGYEPAGTVTPTSEADRQTYGDIVDEDTPSRGGIPGGGSPEADLMAPNSNENTDGDAVFVADDGSTVLSPEDSKSQNENVNTLDEDRAVDGLAYTDASDPDNPETNVVGSENLEEGDTVFAAGNEVLGTVGPTSEGGEEGRNGMNPDGANQVGSGDADEYPPGVGPNQGRGPPGFTGRGAGGPPPFAGGGDGQGNSGSNSGGVGGALANLSTGGKVAVAGGTGAVALGAAWYLGLI